MYHFGTGILSPAGASVYHFYKSYISKSTRARLLKLAGMLICDILNPQTNSKSKISDNRKVDFLATPSFQTQMCIWDLILHLLTIHLLFGCKFNCWNTSNLSKYNVQCTTLTLVFYIWQGQAFYHFYKSHISKSKRARLLILSGMLICDILNPYTNSKTENFG